MSELNKLKYEDRLHDSLYWWLGNKKPFIVNNEYKIELLHIDHKSRSAKIRITNLKNNTVEVVNEKR